MKCDELKEYYYYEDRVITPSTHLYRVYHADKVDAAIAELKKENARLKDELDAANNQCENLINSATDIMLRQDKVNDTKCAEIESLKASHYAEMVDAGMRERRLKRTLWLARAKIAKAMKAVENLNNYLSLHKNSKWFGIYATRIDTWYYKWDNVERKCLKKAEEFKEEDQ